MLFREAMSCKRRRTATSSHCKEMTYERLAKAWQIRVRAVDTDEAVSKRTAIEMNCKLDMKMVKDAVPLQQAKERAFYLFVNYR